MVPYKKIFVDNQGNIKLDENSLDECYDSSIGILVEKWTIIII